MDTSTIAIIVSIFSVGVAGLSLGWNIYRDVILKPKVDIMFGVRTIIAEALPHRPEYVVITATNFGPGSVNISMIQARNSSFWKRFIRKTKRAVIIHDYTNPLSAKLPAKLEMGDKIDLLLPYDKECLLKEEWTHIGVFDYYGNSHWAPKRHVKEARIHWLKDHG